MGKTHWGSHEKAWLVPSVPSQGRFPFAMRLLERLGFETDQPTPGIASVTKEPPAQGPAMQSLGLGHCPAYPKNRPAKQGAIARGRVWGWLHSEITVRALLWHLFPHYFI